MALSLAPLILFCAEKSAVLCANGKMSEKTRKFSCVCNALLLSEIY